ncbi:Phosphoglycerate dehydrogenase or related dehydrogenase [Geosmithia morbida]|uniref:Phosphoglycerate dehydrogenase or related dehydrogenase n=1 Tax=Geosmithia morbida TaxID=1094350 RepID=A0A9P4YYC1_9HYPO|nr:Phosphoglycerate dehydrogenase or related dehydrogenase [Geosmithia morbida]KAF4124752.1 Phosphoglycerate dehydrogenase or related dehydrogenase [Geosmithia morbida]
MALGKEKLLVFLPVDPPQGWLDKVSTRFPNLEVRWEKARILSSGGLSTLEEVSAEVLDGITLLCIIYPPERPGLMRDVRFVQMVTSGSDSWAGHAKYKDPAVDFCSISGIHAPQITEWVIGTWLSHQRFLKHYAMVQRDEASWRAEWDVGAMRADSAGRRIGILGYGSVGRNVGRVAQALGMQVYAYTGSPRTTPESRRLPPGSTYLVPGTGDPDGVVPARWFSGDLDSFLSLGIDLLVVSMPLTDSTRGSIGRRQFDILARSSSKTFVCNVARGPIIDTDALVDALHGGLIGGAALDVTDPEPLPDGHPLWKAPNLLITPHVSWQSSSFFERTVDVLFTNLEKMDVGEPLVNLVKKA